MTITMLLFITHMALLWFASVKQMFQLHVSVFLTPKHKTSRESLSQTIYMLGKEQWEEMTAQREIQRGAQRERMEARAPPKVYTLLLCPDSSQ